MTTFRDYSVTLQDSTGRTAVVFINADSINEARAAGASSELAVEEVEQNAFFAAIARGDIGADCWVVA